MAHEGPLRLHDERGLEPRLGELPAVRVLDEDQTSELAGSTRKDAVLWSESVKEGQGCAVAAT